LKITSCHFDRAACRSEDEPTPVGPVVVFLGRSNVGKSSLINALVGETGLARTSSRPGRTQAVHFYRVNDAFHFVDMPGYGYAEAPEAVRRTWKPMIEGFLGRWSEHVAMAVLVVDARREPTELDGVMRAWLESGGVPFVVAGTKADKLSGNGRSAAARTLRSWVEPGGAGDAAVLVSARGGDGVREIWKRLDRALAGARERRGSRGARWTSAN
jgi:GTP-binding protein